MTDDKPIFSKEEWEAICAKVVAQMRDHVNQFVTPIVRFKSLDDGLLEGTGYYVENDGLRFTMTNKHVISAPGDGFFGHTFHGCREFFRFANPFVIQSFPEDLALGQIDDVVWQISQHQSAALPISRFANRHAPVDRELFFVMGYSRDRSKLVFGELFSRSSPILCQEVTPPEGTHPFHFTLDYRTEKGKSIDGSSLSAPGAKGFSGTLVWNTRYTECSLAGRPWTPDCAVVTGILQRWDTSGACIVATRAEHVIPFLRYIAWPARILLNPRLGRLRVIYARLWCAIFRAKLFWRRFSKGAI
jgi:hypothetical protein